MNKTKELPTIAVAQECPYCSGHDLEWGHVEQYDESQVRDVSCENCGKDFQQVDTTEFFCYRLTDKDGKEFDVYPKPPKLPPRVVFSENGFSVIGIRKDNGKVEFLKTTAQALIVVSDVKDADWFVKHSPQRANYHDLRSVKIVVSEATND